MYFSVDLLLQQYPRLLLSALITILTLQDVSNTRQKPSSSAEFISSKLKNAQYVHWNNLVTPTTNHLEIIKHLWGIWFQLTNAMTIHMSFWVKRFIRKRKHESDFIDHSRRRRSRFIENVEFRENYCMYLIKQCKILRNRNIYQLTANVFIGSIE